MNYLSTSTLVALLPAIEVNFPFVGLVDLRLYILAFVTFVLLNILFWALRKVVIIRLESLSSRTTTDIDDTVVQAVKGVRAWAYTVASIYLSLQFFEFGEVVDKIFTGIFLLVIVWQLVEIAGVFIRYFATRFLEKDEDGDGIVDPNAATASNMVKLMAKIVLWALGGIFVLSNLGIEVTSLIAGLGIGGIAVAFALQGILSDLFASFSIYFDKPFRVGDFIIIGDDMGTVEHIGIKSTRIRTLQGQELVVSNAELTTTRVNNYKKMEERRIVVNFGVIYETPLEKVKQIPHIIAAAFEAVEGGRLDRVHFTTLGDYALNFELVYYVESADYVEYLDIQQAFNYELMERFAHNRIEFAYPTQVVFTKAG